MNLPTTLSVLVVGLMLGLRHALEPDHVATVAMLVTQRQRVWDAAFVGALWGIGHLVTVAAAGGAILSLGITVPPWLSSTLELAVMAGMAGLGLSTLRGIWLQRSGRATPRGLRAPPPRWRGRVRAPVAWGMLHGFAGTAALVVLISAQMPTFGAAMAYLGAFGLGATAGMFVMSLAVGMPFVLSARVLRPLQRWATVAVALASLVVAGAMGLGMVGG